MQAEYDPEQAKKIGIANDIDHLAELLDTLSQKWGEEVVDDYLKKRQELHEKVQKEGETLCGC